MASQPKRLRRVIGLGAGGHAKVVLEILQLDRRLVVVGLLDANDALVGHRVLGVPVLGNDTLLPILAKEGVTHFFVGVGTVGNVEPRRRLYEGALSLGLEPASAIHPRATISPSARLGTGATVMAGAVINAEARLGVNVIVNTGAIIEHDCRVGDHVHVASGARLTGGVQVEPGAFIGAGAIVRQGIKIAAGAIIGAGAVVVKDVEPWTVVAGVPARVLRRLGAGGEGGPGWEAQRR